MWVDLSWRAAVWEMPGNVSHAARRPLEGSDLHEAIPQADGSIDRSAKATGALID